MKKASMARLEIKGFVEASFCDWDGRISAVVFLAGCNLRCPFCQNGDLVLAPERLESTGFDTLSDYLCRNREWIDGVVLTGGEPTISDGLQELAGRLKALGFGVKLDTNGTRPDVVRQMIDRGLVDYVAMDVKAPLDERYGAAAGAAVDLGAIRSSIATVMSMPGEAYEFRTTLVPGLVGEGEVEEVARAVRGAARLVLQQFVPDKCLDTGLRGAVPYTDAAVEGMVGRAHAHVKRCFFRGKPGSVLPRKGEIL
ncbi:MAG: anaerobic ribonucleoside-triphosphate reductase activating protein [bacterium]